MSELCKSVGDSSKPEIPLKCILSSSSGTGKTIMSVINANR